METISITLFNTGLVHQWLMCNLEKLKSTKPGLYIRVWADISFCVLRMMYGKTKMYRQHMMTHWPFCVFTMKCALMRALNWWTRPYGLPCGRHQSILPGLFQGAKGGRRRLGEKEAQKQRKNGRRGKYWLGGVHIEFHTYLTFQTAGIIAAAHCWCSFLVCFLPALLTSTVLLSQLCV